MILVTPLLSARYNEDKTGVILGETLNRNPVYPAIPTFIRENYVADNASFALAESSAAAPNGDDLSRWIPLLESAARLCDFVCIYVSLIGPYVLSSCRSHGEGELIMLVLSPNLAFVMLLSLYRTLSRLIVLLSPSADQHTDS